MFDAAWNEAPCISDLPDPTNDADRRLIAAALAAQAELFVTGDKRVLDWQASGGMRIVTPRQAWIILFAPHLAH